MLSKLMQLFLIIILWHCSTITEVEYVDNFVNVSINKIVLQMNLFIKLELNNSWWSGQHENILQKPFLRLRRYQFIFKVFISLQFLSQYLSCNISSMYKFRVNFFLTKICWYISFFLLQLFNFQQHKYCYNYSFAL